MSKTVLWDYPKSSASYRVRIALNLAGISYEKRQVNLLESAHKSPEHQARNPQGLVPVLDIKGHRFTQSLAIIEYLSETGSVNFLSGDPVIRQKIRRLAYVLAVDVHPVCNLSVMRFATGGEEPKRSEWMHQFIAPGLEAFEALLAQEAQSPYCFGDAPSLADICLIPQLYNAQRWGVPFQHFQRINHVSQNCARHPAFEEAKPE